MRDAALWVILLFLVVLLSPWVNPSQWPARLAVLLGIALAVAAAAALLPESFRTTIDETFAPGQILATASAALVLNVALVCTSIYGVARHYPEVDARQVTMTFVALFSLVFVLSMCYWTLSVEDGACMDQSLSKIDAVYFTLTTMTTTGYGDIAPATQVCRGLVSEQLATNFVVVTFIVGVLVSRAASTLSAGRSATR